MNSEIKKFIEQQTNLIKPLYKNLQLSYWNASTTGKKEEYEKYEKCQKKMALLFNNSKIFSKIKEFMRQNIKDNLVKRQLVLLYHSYLSNQGDIELINKILKKSTEIEQKFNKFRAEINGKSYTDNEIKEILRHETDSEKLRIAWEASKMQGALVAQDLVELIKLRNELARSLGFKDYYEFSLECSEQKREDILLLFDNLDKLTYNSFKKIKKEIDDFLRKKHSVDELKPWHYQDLFFQEAPEIYDINLNKFYKRDILQIAEKFYSSVGLEVADILARSDLYEREGKYQHAYCMDLDREGDIRSVMNIKNNENWMSTVLHELGHGVYWKYIDKNLPFLLRDTSHILTTEAIAQFFGRNSKNLSFIKRLSINEKLDKEKLEKSLQMRELVFARWSLVMTHFESEMYKNPEQNLNKLWYALVRKYQLIDFSRDFPDWASKIHFVSSPVYYHNYIIGELYASQINNQIRIILGKDTMKNLDYANENVGNYFKNKVFFPGAIYSWDNLIEKSTGEKLTPKYWTKEFCN